MQPDDAEESWLDLTDERLSEQDLKRLDDGDIVAALKTYEVYANSPLVTNKQVPKRARGLMGFSDGAIAIIKHNADVLRAEHARRNGGEQT